MSKRAKKQSDVFGDIEIRSVSEAFGGIRLLSTTGTTGNVLLELSGFAGVLASAGQPRSFLIKLASWKQGGPAPVAIAQNDAIEQPGGYTDFKLTTVHQNAQPGDYRLTGSIEARVPGGPIEEIAVQELTYRVI